MGSRPTVVRSRARATTPHRRHYRQTRRYRVLAPAFQPYIRFRSVLALWRRFKFELRNYISVLNDMKTRVGLKFSRPVRDGIH